jgi:hypothetical protein
MYLNHPLVPGFPLTLREGEERDRDYLAGVFSEVWTIIPENEQTAILSRGYGQITVDVLDIPATGSPSGRGAEIRLPRAAIDTFARKDLVYFLAHEFALRLDDYDHPDLVVQLKRRRRKIERRAGVILQRWGFLTGAKAEYTAEDKQRIQSILGKFPPDESESRDE